MRSNPIELVPGDRHEQREINWGFDRAEMHRSPARGWRRFGVYTALFLTAGLAMMLVPSVPTNWAGRGETEGLSVAGSTPVAIQRTSQDAINSPDSAIKHQLVAEQERQRGEVLAHQLASARGDVETLTARLTALTDARTEAEKALQTAQASAAAQKLALEQERQRGDALLRDLASAREEVEARKATANAAEGSAKNALASATEQTQAAEQERQRGEVLAHQLASARGDVETLTARLTALTDARTEAEKALQTAQASAAAQKLALEQERQRGDALLRDLASAREEVEARKATANAAEGSAKNALASATEQTQAAEQERQRGEVLAHQLASARGDVETLTARLTALTDARTEAEKALQTAQASAAAQKLALEQERQRGDALLRDLASARELVAKRVQNGIAASRIEDGQAVQRPNASFPAGSVSLTTTQSVLVKRATPDGPEPASDPHHTAADFVGKGTRAAASAREPQNAGLGDPPQVAAFPPRAITEQQIALWVKRGQEFIAAGDFVSARLVFQRAAETGNANAAFLLAGTYDASVLDLNRAMGVAPDTAKARLWYEKATNLGSPEAARRLELLVQQRR